MGFEEMLALLKTPPEEGVPDTIYDDITAAYNDVSGRADSAAAKIGELTAANETLLGQINDLKAKNYDLLTAVDNGPNTAVDDGDSDDDTDDDTDIFDYETA